MPQYDVTLCRTQPHYRTLRVEAEDHSTARRIALDQSGNLDFNLGKTGEPTVVVEDIVEVKS